MSSNICCECTYNTLGNTLCSTNDLIVKKHPLLNIYLCQNCCNNLFKYKTITTEEIKDLYGFSRNEVKNKCLNTYDIQNNNLYLTKDIHQIRKSKNNDILLRYKKRQFKRNELFKKHNIPSKDNINCNLWNFVIEDFFDYSIATPKIHIDTIINRANAAVILTNLNIVKNIYLIYYFIRDKDSHPYTIIKEAIALSKIKKKVFDIQNDNISSFLSQSDLLNWSTAY